MGLLYGELCGASLHCVFFIYYAALCCTFFYVAPLHVAVL